MASITGPSPSRPAALGLVLLLGLAVVLNYVDRGAIAIAAPLLKPELGLSATEFGIAVSAFFWVYAPIQYFVGWACDRWCVYRLIAAGLTLWAVSTMLMGLVGGLASLIALRLLLGLGESVTFPGAAKIIARHVAAEHRGMANAVVAAGIALGPVVGTLGGGLIVAAYGWRPMFVLFGLLTLLWVVPWLMRARRLPAFAAANREPAVPVGKIVRQRAVWAMGAGHFVANYTLYFVVTWLPLYLVQSRGLGLKQMTYLATLGFLAQAVSAVLLGWTSDAWTRSGRREAAIRRAAMVGGNILLAVAVIGLMQARSSSAIALWLMAVGAANATGGVNLYAIAQMFAGPRAAGSFIGIQNATGNMAGIVSPVITGMIIDATGAYDNAFIVTAGVGLLGALWWALAVPRIRALDLE